MFDVKILKNNELVLLYEWLFTSVEVLTELSYIMVNMLRNIKGLTQLQSYKIDYFFDENAWVLT